MPASTFFELLGVSVFWGGVFVSGKLAMAGVPPVTVAWLRMLVSAVSFAAIAARTEPAALRRGPGADAGRFLLLGLVGVTAYHALFNLGLQVSGAAKAALLMPMNMPVFTALFSAWLLRERLSPRQLAGVGCSTAGVVLVLLGGAGGLAAVRAADGILLVAIACFALYNVWGRQVLARHSPLAANTYPAAVGALGLLPLAALERPWSALAAAPAGFWWHVAYLSVFGTVLAYLWWYRGIARIGASRTAVFAYLVPVWAVLLSALVLGERVSPWQLAGGALAVAGVALVSTRVDRTLSAAG